MLNKLDTVWSVYLCVHSLA